MGWYLGASILLPLMEVVQPHQFCSHQSPLMIWVYNMGLIDGVKKAILGAEEKAAYECWMCPAKNNDAAAFLVHIKGCDNEQRSATEKVVAISVFQKTANTV